MNNDVGGLSQALASIQNHDTGLSMMSFANYKRYARKMAVNTSEKTMKTSGKLTITSLQ